MGVHHTVHPHLHLTGIDLLAVGSQMCSEPLSAEIARE